MTKHKYLYATLLVMTFGGTFKIRTRSPIRKLLFYIWRIVTNTTILLFLISCFIDLKNKGFNKLDLVSRHYVYFGSIVFVSFKANYYFIKDRILSEMVTQMQTTFKYKTEIGFDERDMSKYIKVSNIIAFLWIFYGSVVGQLDILLAVIFKKEREITLPMWLPFDWTVSPNYEIAVLIQLFAHQVLITAGLSTDTFFANTMVLVSGQFKLLGWEMKHLLHKTLLENNVELRSALAYLHPSHNGEFSEANIDKDVLDILDSEKFKNDLLRNLKDLSEFHQFLLTLCSILDQFFSLPNLLCFSIILSCAVLLEYALVVAKNLFAAAVTAFYVFASLTMLLIPCFFGNLLTTQAEEFLNDLYDMPWYIGDSRLKTNFMMLQQVAGRPILFSIGKFGFLSLQTYLWIIRTSYSYLTVLRHVAEDV